MNAEQGNFWTSKYYKSSWLAKPISMPKLLLNVGGIKFLANVKHALEKNKVEILLKFELKVFEKIRSM